MLLDDIQRFLHQTNGSSFDHFSTDIALDSIQRDGDIKNLRIALHANGHRFSRAHHYLIAELLKGFYLLTVEGQDPIADFNACCFPSSKTRTRAEITIVYLISGTGDLIDHWAYISIGISQSSSLRNHEEN